MHSLDVRILQLHLMKVTYNKIKVPISTERAGLKTRKDFPKKVSKELIHFTLV